jgi:laccase
MTVNGRFPGPAVEISDGDGVVVKVTNEGRYNVTVHWHGVRQRRTGWSDGPEYVTQCPIRPGESYSYRFTVQGQEGTLWWHAHSSWLRATVHGALVIRPRAGVPYPFNPPTREAPILLGTYVTTCSVVCVNISNNMDIISLEHSTRVLHLLKLISILLMVGYT